MNLAYTSATLGLHLDLPFYTYTPGVQVPACSFILGMSPYIQILQCIKQYSGVGEYNLGRED